MKKITLLVILFFAVNMQFIIAQTLTHSTSQTIEIDNSLACELFTGIIKDNTFYRHFVLSDFGITSSYDITSIDYGVEKLVNAPGAGYPVTIGIYSVTGGFPSGSLTLITEVTENLQDQTLTLRNVPITASILANSEFVVAVSVPSDDISDGGSGMVTFQIGSNNDGETDDSYISAPNCNLNIPTAFVDQGRPDINIVMNVNGNGSTASTGDLDLVSFNYYPNPVKEKLNMRSQEEISSVEIYNILGQQVKSMKPSQLNASIDLTSLSSGTYMVRARVNDKVGTFKVVKE